MNRTLRARPFGPLLAAACMLGMQAPALAQAPVEPTTWEEALARYREVMKRLPFRYHTQGRDSLAKTRRPEAFELLKADYQGSKEYPEYAKYTVASMLGREFGAPEFTAPLALLRASCDKPADAWLWVLTLRNQARNGGGADVLEVATRAKTPLQRACGILALGMAQSDQLTGAIVQTCAEFPKKEKEADRIVLLGAMTGAIHENAKRVNDEKFREGLRAYISLLGEDIALTETMKVQVARLLQPLLNAPAAFMDPASWLALLERGDVKAPAAGRTVVKPSFFGIESDGERICYVLDLSDSMCREIAPNVKPSGPVTGPKQKKPKGVMPDESDLPWAIIRTRWDLAREQLKISLQRLSGEKYFSIVWFGDSSGSFDSTKGMVRATKANVAKAIAELDSIKPDKPDPVKAPDGVLRGKTNMHSGLRRAFGLAGKGTIEEGAYVDPSTLKEGCDTIFLLSDGAPSWDDFEVRDKDYGEDQVVVDTEYGAAAARTDMLVYHGPYVLDDWLVDDVIRMNTFRRARIHCIGFGEAKMQLLDRIAKSCGGQVYSVGAPKPQQQAPGQPGGAAPGSAPPGVRPK